MSDPLPACGWLWLAWLAVWLVAAGRTARTAVPEPRAQRLRHTVPSAITALLLMWPARGSALGAVWLSGPARWAGLALTVAGITFSAWARLHLGRFWSGDVALKERHELVRSGPYRLVRHPIYTGVLTAIAGTATAGGRVAGLLGCALAVLVFTRKLRREEALMLSKFGAAYERYRGEVPALLPRIPGQRRLR